MRLKVAGKHIKLFGKFAQVTFSKLYFKVSGATFPESYYRIDNENYNLGGWIFYSRKPNRLTINYADGNVITYDFVRIRSDQYQLGVTPANIGNGTVSDSVRFATYTYADSYSGIRTISLSFQDPLAVYYLRIQYCKVYSIFPADIDKLGLTSLSLSSTNNITSFPPAIANSKITLLVLSNIGPALSEKIPDEILGMKLTHLDLSSSVNLSDLETSNFRKLNKLKSTLRTLLIGGCKVTNLPNEIEEIPLTSLKMHSNNYISTPPQVNNITTLSDLDLGGQNMTSWGDFRALINLTLLRCYTAPLLTTDVPDWFKYLVNMKTLAVYQNFRTQARLDAFITSFYNHLTTYAPITGSNSLLHRGMTVNIYTSNTYDLIPSGIYQLPPGYVQGVSNGTPTSSLERICGLVNQYGQNWIYRAI